MWDREDSQEVGLEAAILERVRNSSLVKWFCADNVAGLKRTAEAVAAARFRPPPPFLDGVVGALLGRGASCAGRSPGVTPGGPRGSENAGMSNEFCGGNPQRRLTKGSRARFIRPGLVGS